MIWRGHVTLGLLEEHLGGLVKRKEIAMVTVAEFVPQELTDEQQFHLIEREPFSRRLWTMSDETARCRTRA